MEEKKLHSDRKNKSVLLFQRKHQFLGPLIQNICLKKAVSAYIVVCDVLVWPIRYRKTYSWLILFKIVLHLYYKSE